MKITSSIHLLNLLAGVMASKKPDSDKFFHQKDLEIFLEYVFNSFFRKFSKSKIQKKTCPLFEFLDQGWRFSLVFVRFDVRVVPQIMISCGFW